jgi:hypothetical protein
MTALKQFFGFRSVPVRPASYAPKGGRPLEWREAAGAGRAMAVTVGRSPTADELVQELNALGMVWAEDERLGERAG